MKLTPVRKPIYSPIELLEAERERIPAMVQAMLTHLQGVLATA